MSDTMSATESTTMPRLTSNTMPAAGSQTLPAVGVDTLPALTSTSSMVLPTAPSKHNFSVTPYITFKLDLDLNNYAKWKKILYFILTKFCVAGHVKEESDPLHEEPAWRHKDITIVLWMYPTITDELFDSVTSPHSTAYHVWNQLHTLSRDNQTRRAIHIGAEFHATVQSDMSIGAYYSHLKALADVLADINEPFSDKTLTLQMIRGLNRRFQLMATVLPMQVSFPTFIQAASHLLKEIGLNERERLEDSFALVIIDNGNNAYSDRGGNRRHYTNSTDYAGNSDDRGNSGERIRGRGVGSKASFVPIDGTYGKLR